MDENNPEEELPENIQDLEEAEFLDLDHLESDDDDDYVDAAGDEQEDADPPVEHAVQVEDVARLNDMPNHVHWREHVLHFFHGRRGFRGRMQELNLLRNWIVRRRIRMRPVDGGGSDDGSDESEDDEEKKKEEILKNINFDKNLPSAHSYLGEMEECSGVAYQDQDTYQTISILYIHDFVLIPGQTLPLMFGRPNEVDMMRRIMSQNDKTFGILSKSFRPWQDDNDLPADELHDYGCTAEIRSFQDRTQHEVGSLRVVVVGRQKFKIMEKRRQINGNILAKVKIVEDVELPELHRGVWLRGGSVKCGSLFEVHKKKFPLIRRSSLVTAWPSWLYRMHDVDHLRLQIFHEMREWNQQLEERHCPEGASDFSFWVLTNLPVSDHIKLQLLRMNSAVQRLRFELHLYQKCTTLACSDCSEKIAHRSDVFSMSVSGPMAAYVNPGGYVHETLTLHKATGIVHRGRKSTEHSWFPGYAWTVCECRSCGRHIGWKFTATKSSLTPERFWGLTRTALKHMVEADSSLDRGTGSEAS